MDERESKVSRLTYERLREVLEYKPDTGEFIWISATSVTKRYLIGRVAGTVAYGYRMIRIDDVFHKASRLAHFYMTGSQPKGQMDHIDRNRDNNKWTNLRVVTIRENCLNRNMMKNNKTGHENIFWSPHARKWKIFMNMPIGKPRQAGFKKLEEAVEAVKKLNEERDEMLRTMGITPLREVPGNIVALTQ